MAAALQLLVSNVPDTGGDSVDLSGIDINVPDSRSNDNISGYIMQAWTAARSAKDSIGITQRLREADRRRAHKYDPDKALAIKNFGGSDVYLGLGDFQCRKITAWLRDLAFGQGEKPWTLEPTPIPELSQDYEAPIQEALAQINEQYSMQTGEPMPDELREEIEKELRQNVLQEIQRDAKEIARNMERKIDDQYTESGFYEALYDAIDDIATYPAAFIKGPLLVTNPKLSWKQNPDGSWDVSVDRGLHLQWLRVDPHNVFPAANSKHVQNRYLIELTRMTRRELGDLKGTPGVDSDTVDKILDKHAAGGLTNWLGFTDDIVEDEFLDHMHPEALFDVLMFWGDLSGKDLQDWGVNASIDPTRTYSCCAYMVGEYVFKITLNYHPLDKKPYHSTSFSKKPDCIWGQSGLEICAPFDDSANANVRALNNNMGLASGPQVEIDVNRLAEGQTITTLVPWKLWQTKSNPYNNTGQPAIRFMQPDDRSTALLQVFEFWVKVCDEYLGMPPIMTGLEAPTGAGRTASGFAMFLTNANKFIKQVVLNLDSLMISCVEEQYIFNMRYLEDPSIKGDLRPKARGATSLSIKEAQQIRQTEFLASLANPIDAQIVPPEGRAYLIRENARSLDIDPDRVIPPEHLQLLAQQPPMPTAGPGPQQSLQQQGAQSTMPMAQPMLPNVGQLGDQETLSNGDAVADFFSNS